MAGVEVLSYRDVMKPNTIETSDVMYTSKQKMEKYQEVLKIMVPVAEAVQEAWDKLELCEDKFDHEEVFNWGMRQIMDEYILRGT